MIKIGSHAYYDKQQNQHMILISIEFMYNRTAHILYTNVDEIFQTRELHDL